MVAVNVYEAKTSLSALLARVEKGEEIVIARNGRPVARLVPADASALRRVPGMDKGRIWYADDLHEPLPADAVELFER
ncbi:MAG: type II toxin-antitoxin system Phd/YefM family antitoxin [Deltaproteobacteria bacterium]|nr:type II toxin-antitoxin system Phd/YefM family antitoxin [Deltaproteobacteria bacterium]